MADRRYTKTHEWLTVDGKTVTVEVRGREAPAEVVKLPFYRGSARSALAPAKSRPATP